MAERFLTAKTIREAAAWKNEEAAFLAGGTEINRLGSFVSPSVLISVRKLEELKSIRPENGRVVIGSGCTFQEILESSDAPGYLKEACLFMGSRTKRNMATIGGNISLCRDDSYLLPALMAAGAVISVMDGEGNTKEICIEDYVTERVAFENVLILSVSVPQSLAFIRSLRQANTVESNAVLTVCLSIEDGKYRAAAAVKKAGLFVLLELSDRLMKEPELSEEALIAWAKEADLPIRDDRVFGSSSYRRYLIGVTFARLLREYGKGGQS